MFDALMEILLAAKTAMWAALLVWFLRLPEWSSPTTPFAVATLVAMIVLNLGLLVALRRAPVRDDR
jgi:hypothetical protein